MSSKLMTQGWDADCRIRSSLTDFDDCVLVGQGGGEDVCLRLGGHEHEHLLVSTSKAYLCIVVQGPHGVLPHLPAVDPGA